jgi:preprotein translocase subunit YajC
MKWEWFSEIMQVSRDAWAQAPGDATGGSGIGTVGAVLPFVLIFVLFYFLLLRPQQQRQKSQKQMLSALKGTCGTTGE